MRHPARSIAKLLIALCVVMVAYWTLWFSQRSLLASDSTRVYYGFENAFPLADALLTLGLALTAWCLWNRQSSAVAFGLMSAGGGLYLFAMDVLYDIEHGIWSKGAGGIIELAINVVTLAASTLLARWIWQHRREFDRVESA